MTKEAKLRASTASEDKMLLDFSYLHAVFIVGAVLTYLVDLTLGKSQDVTSACQTF